jgi:RHS repeat-associated protein
MNLEYIHTTEGRIRVAGSNYYYDYYLKDHLGNTRVVFTDENNDNTSEVLQVDNYYPFGMRHGQANTFGSGGKTTQYMYNGKELQEDFNLDWYDYGARMYDASLGRFMVPDPLTDFAPGISPYNYVFNNPVSMIDIDGLWPGFVDDWLKKQKKKKQNNHKNQNRICRNLGKPKIKHKKYKTKIHATLTLSPPPGSGRKEGSFYDRIGDINPIDHIPGNIPTDDEEPTITLSYRDIPEIPTNPDPEYITRDGQPIKARTDISFDHTPFGGNESFIKNKSNTYAFLAPIAQYLKDNPEYVVSVIISTNIVRAKLYEEINMDGGEKNGTPRDLLYNRGKSIREALDSLGVNLKQIKKVDFITGSTNSINLSID